MSISPEHRHPQPENPELGASSDSAADEYELLWKEIPEIDPELEPKKGQERHGYSITSPPGFVDADLSEDAKRLYAFLLTDGNPRDLIQWWAGEEGVDLKKALAELSEWNVLEGNQHSIRVKRRYFSAD